MAKTNKPGLRSLLLLLTVSNLISCRRLLNVEEVKPQNTTASNSTQQYEKGSELQPTNGPLQTTDMIEERSDAVTTTAQHSSVLPPSQLEQANGTTVTVRNGTKHHPAGNESSIGTESPPHDQLPVKNGSSGFTTPSVSSAPTLSVSVGPEKGTSEHAINSVTSVATMSQMGTNGPSRLRTTVQPVVPPTMEVRTSATENHTPTKTRSTQKADKSTKDCPTAEPRREGLVGRCLIVIACLTALATVFIVTTIVLATKLAGSRYRHRSSLLLETEMVCISALMNDSDHPVPTPRHPKSNGALIPITEDEDGDDLTLNSFLPDTDCVA